MAKSFPKKVKQKGEVNEVRAQQSQSNITVLSGAVATRILFRGHRAIGVEFSHEGKSHRVQAFLEVVLSLGAIHTPKLLMQSGIGDQAELKSANIPVLQALPGVGRNLHDHVSFGCIWENDDQSLPRAPRSQTACFWKTKADLDAPDFYMYAKHGPLSTMENAVRFNPPPDSWSLVAGMRPKSRGTVCLTGPDPSHSVAIDANYLGDPLDLRTLIAGLRTVREIGNSPALRPFTGREIAPGPLNGADLECFFRDGLSTFWHQSGTAKMGQGEMSVVDGRLKVHGIERLRIADASILPRVTAGNTMAPCVVIGERAAEFLRGEHGLQTSPTRVLKEQVVQSETL
jgi:choline dehydrogenase-like flavoprotein